MRLALLAVVALVAGCASFKGIEPRSEVREPAELCKHLSHDPGAMTRLIDKLEKMALVRRVRGGEDRRSARLEVTARGKATRAEVTQVQVNVLNRMLRGFSRAEARLLERLLKRMLDNAAELAAE